ncbi:MAG TPA: hypothetical protein VND93_18450 [Myxococcales bacterium]|nr:hypothetical protein [Myxococcales bacterium]
MRGAFRGLLAAFVLAGCVPRADLRGTGGSGSFETIQARVLVLIASHQYAHAREYLELAADLTQEQHDRFEQMISAAERGLTPFLEGAIQHIFRDSPGHFVEDTAEARELIQTTITEGNFVGLREGVLRVYQRLLDTGVQIWVYVKDGTIRDGGQNLVPRSTEGLLKGPQ